MTETARNSELSLTHIRVQADRQFVCWLVGCLLSQQRAGVSQICEDRFTCCHTEIDVAEQTFCLTQSQYTGPTSPNAVLVYIGLFVCFFLQSSVLLSQLFSFVLVEVRIALSLL